MVDKDERFYIATTRFTNYTYKEKPKVIESVSAIQNAILNKSTINDLAKTGQEIPEEEFVYEEKPVNAKIVIKNFNNNISKIHSIITNLSNDENLLDDCEIGCQNSLDNAITTNLNSTNLI